MHRVMDPCFRIFHGRFVGRPRSGRPIWFYKPAGGAWRVRGNMARTQIAGRGSGVESARILTASSPEQPDEQPHACAAPGAGCGRRGDAHAGIFSTSARLGPISHGLVRGLHCGPCPGAPPSQRFGDRTRHRRHAPITGKNREEACPRPMTCGAGCARRGDPPSPQQPHAEANHVRAKYLDGPLDRSVRPPRNSKSGWAALGTAKNNCCFNCVLQSLTMIRKGLWGVQFQVRVSVMGHNRIHALKI
jgi:hypothetical protein